MFFMVILLMFSYLLSARAYYLHHTRAKGPTQGDVWSYTVRDESCNLKTGDRLYVK